MSRGRCCGRSRLTAYRPCALNSASRSCLTACRGDESLAVRLVAARGRAVTRRLAPGEAALLLLREREAFDGEQLELEAAAVGGVLQGDLLTEGELQRLAAVGVGAARDPDLYGLAVRGDRDEHEGGLRGREGGLEL